MNGSIFKHNSRAMMASNDALMQIEARLIRIEDKLDAMERRADANGQQAATWTTPKSWAEAQKRPPQAGDG